MNCFDLICHRFYCTDFCTLQFFIGSTEQYVNSIIKKVDGVINKTFVEMLDALGYDIQLTYVKKEEA